jgi:transposase
MSKLTDMKKFREYAPKQNMLLPPSLDEWLSEDHPARYVSEVVEELDLSEIYGDYRELRGQPPYNPLMMMKVWVYAMCRGIMSSRKIEQALYDDIGFRYLSANQQPDHWVISEFRRRHHKAMGKIFAQTVKMADRAGLVELNQVAIDGTKVKANASKHRGMSYARMEREEKRLQEEIERLMEEADRIDELEDKAEAEGKGGYWLPEELATKEKRLAVIQKAKAELEAEAKEKVEKEQRKREKKAKEDGREYKRRKKAEEAKPKGKGQKNFTDPESRIMKDSNKAYIQGYNAQASVDAKTQIIVACEVSNNASDSEELPGQIRQVKENTGRRPREASADAGYYSEENLKILEEEGIEAFIPAEKIRHREWREEKAPRGRIPEGATQRYLMWRKLRTKRGRERYRLRQTSVEPVFGYMKEQMGLRRFLLRGLEKVRSIWQFACGVHNMMKIYRAKMRVLALA